jgi:DNA-binding CsgD family transcriptional regulator
MLAMDVGRARGVKRRLLSLCQSGFDSTALSLQAEALIRPVIPFDLACWHNVDPATAIVTSVMGEAPPESPLLPVLEYGTVDVNQYAALARSRTGAAGLRQATGDTPESSQRYRELLRPMEIEDELTASFVIDGNVWGSARLYRTKRWPPFDSVEVAFMASVCRILAEGFRMALLAPVTGLSDSTYGPGIITVDERCRLEAITPSAERWLREIVDVVPSEGGALPHPVYAVATRAFANGREADGDRLMARARVPTRSGSWLVLHGALLRDSRGERAAVIVEPAPAAELAPIILQAYGLTERERQVTELALQGLPSKQIALTLGISSYTVSDFLKSVFEKASVNSRTELAARLFFDHYYPNMGNGS